MEALENPVLPLRRRGWPGKPGQAGHDEFNLIEKRPWPAKLRKRTEPNECVSLPSDQTNLTNTVMRGQKRVEDARRRAGVPRIHAFTAFKGVEGRGEAGP